MERGASDAIALEPFHESSYRVLMRAHALAGNRAEAIRTYNVCVQLLADELGVGPDPTTVTLGEQFGAAVAAPGTGARSPSRSPTSSIRRKWRLTSATSVGTRCCAGTTR